jgi:hypothetical protein
MNEIQEKIAKLYEGGYSSNDIYDVLVYSGLSSDEVANSMASFYDQRAKQEQEAMQKQREELEERYNVLAGQGYGLKKKDSDGEDLLLESSGEYPETQADPLSWSLRNNDEKLLKANSDLNHINSMLASIGAYSTYGSQSFQNDEAINRAYQDLVDSGFRIEGYGEDYVFDVEDSEDIKQKLRELKKAKRADLNRSVEQMNALNKSMGVETNYSVDERNPSSFAEAQKMALMRMRRDEELLRQAVPEYVNEDWDRYQEDMAEARAEAMEANGLGYIARGLGNVYMNANLSFQQTKANWWGDEDAVSELRYHQDMMNNKRQMEKAEIKKKAYSSEERANMNYSEVFANVMAKTMRGEMDLDDFSDLVLGTAVEVPDVASQFVYWGGQAMAGPLGWASIAGQVASMKNADLIADRPDLSSFERGALAITAGIVEGAANAIFSGAEKALSQGIRSMGIKGQIQNAKNSFLNSGKSKFIKDYAKGYISEGFEEGFVELMDYATLAAVDIAAGRRAEDVNPYEFLDAFMLGGLGGGIGPSFQHATSNLGHNKTFAQKMGIHNAIREVEAKYNNAEFGSVEKTRLREVLANLRAEYKSLTEAEGKAYEDFSPADKRSLQKINQELSYLRDMIRAKRDGAGIKLNKDQVAELKKRFDEGWAEKTRIENKYASPESATAKKAQEEVVEVEDVNETPSPAVEKIIDSEEIKTQKQEAIQAQEADDLVKEGNQLSLFDETQAQDQVAEAVAEESTEAETDVEEVVATEETPVAEEAPVVDETKEGVFAEAINAGEGFNLSDRTKVGEGKGKVSIEFANTFNKIREGFALNLPKTGVGALVYDRANFDQIIESRANEKLRERFVEYRAQNGKGPVMGLYDVETNNIILPNDARAEDIREEFAHAMFLPIVNGNANPRVQEKLYQDLVALNERVKDKGFSDYMSKREADYRAAGVSETKLREEMIVGFLNYYKNNPSVFKSVAGRIRQIINSAFKAFGQKGPLVLQTDTDLMNLAEAFTAASEGRRVDVAATKQEFQEAQRRAGRKITAEELKKKPGESDEDFRKRIDDLTTEITGMETPETIEAREADKREGLSFSLKEGRKQFNYLKDTEVFYTEHPFATKENPPVSSGTYSSKRNQKSIRVNDYFHFRNWYNKQTGNQEVTRITDMFFIKDGKVYNVKPPKPKVDKQGNKVTMPVPPTPRFRKMQSQFASDKEANELKKEASRILAEGNNVFKNLPWSGYVSAKMFEPSLPDGVGFSDLSPSDRVSFSQIYRENLIMADRMNLSPDEIADIIEEQTGVKPSPATDIYPFKRFPSGVKIDPALRPDIFQPTGKTMVDENGESAPGYTASYSFLNGFSKNVQPQGRVDFRQFPDRPKGNISDLRGLVFAIGGFDQTRSTPANGIFSGTNSLDYQVEGLNVVTSVIDRHTAKALERFYKQQAEADYKRRVDSGIIKQGDTHLGKLGYGFSVLKPEATFGNPDVFYKTMSDIFDHIAKQENPLVEANRFFSTLTESAREISRRLIEDSVVARYPDGTYKEISPGLARAMSESDGDLRKVEFENIEQVKEAVYMIAFSKNQKNIHKAADQQTVVKRSFEARKEFFKTDFLRYYLETKGDYSFKGFKKPQLASAFLQDFNDPIFLGRPDGVLDAYRTFEYKFENGKFTTPFAYVDSAKGFEGVLVSELPVSEVKYMEDLYGIEDIDPAMKVTVGKEGKRKRYKDREGNIRSRTVVVDVKKQIGELPREEAKKKIKDLNSYSNLVLGAETGGTTILPFHNNDSFSIEPGLFDAKTDQGTFKMRELTGFQRWKNLWVRRLVDKYNDIFDIQRAIENQIGKIDKSMDFQMKEELMYGKAAEALKKLDDKIDGIKKAMKDKKVSLEDLNDYLYAKHVVERNAVIKERIEEENEKRAKQKKKLLPVTESGSGKSNAWAEETLGRFDQAKLRDLEDIETLTREIQDNTRDTYVEFGLESQETIDAWNAMFDNYVPLAGIAVDEEAGVTSSYPTGGAGISVFGPMTKRAKGRKSAAENILAQVIAQNAAAQVKARTNEAVRALYDLAEANPNAEVWQVMDEANSIDPHVVSVRVDGKQKFIRFKDASYAESLRGMNLPETNLLVKILRAPSNWLRRSFTTLNPEFVVSNFARDIQTAVFNAAAEAEIEGGILNGEKVMGDIIKTVPQALRQLTAKQIGRGKNDLIDRYYEDFKEDGAKTGWAYAKRLNDIVKELEDEASETTRTQEILGVGKNIVDFVEGMNEAFEDSVRLASYIAARKNGVSREKAAQLAKNITVNFNKHGEWGQALNGVYLFFNASVQGTARMFRTLGKLKPVARPDGTNREWYERANTAQIMAGGLMLFSGMISMMNAGMSDEDEDGVLFYDKIPDYVKERNLIIMNPRDGKTYYKIPLPYGFNIFSNVGTVAADVSRGGMDADKGMYFLANGLVNAFSPINFGQSESFGRSIAKGGIPTVAKPFFDAWGFNETYFGGPVAAEQLPFGVKRPESSMSFRSPEAVKGWFSYLNEITGGSERVSGVADINPDRMWYVFEYFIGGAGNFVNRTGKTIRSVQGKFKDSDYDIAVNDIPFARIMYGEQSKYYDHGKYRDNETKVKQLFLERKDSKDYKNPRYEGIVKLNNKLKLTEKKLKKLRKERDKAREMKDWVKRSVEIQRIMDEERKVIMEFNKMYDELRK